MDVATKRSLRFAGGTAGSFETTVPREIIKKEIDAHGIDFDGLSMQDKIEIVETFEVIYIYLKEYNSYVIFLQPTDATVGKIKKLKAQTKKEGTK